LVNSTFFETFRVVKAFLSSEKRLTAPMGSIVTFFLAGVSVPKQDDSIYYHSNFFPSEMFIFMVCGSTGLSTKSSENKLKYEGIEVNLSLL